MKKTTSVLGLLATVVLLGSSMRYPAEQVSQGPCICHMIVRADYIDLSGNHPHSDTYCEIFNANYSTPIVINDVYVLGSGGVNDVRAWYTGLYGQVVPPLGRVSFNVNNTTMPTLVPQTSVGNHGVANVVVGWTGGTMEGVVLTSHTIRNATGSQSQRTEVAYVGYPINP